MKSEELSAAMTNGVKCLAFKPDMDSQFLVGTEVILCTMKTQSLVELATKVHEDFAITENALTWKLIQRS